VLLKQAKSAEYWGIGMLMRMVKKAFLLLVWLAVGAFLYTMILIRMWKAGYDDYFPPYPEFLKNIVEHIFPESCCESMWDVSWFALGLFHTAIITTIAFAGYCAYQYFKKPK